MASRASATVLGAERPAHAHRAVALEVALDDHGPESAAISGDSRPSPATGRPIPHRDADAAVGGHLDGAVVAGVGVADHARAGVVGEHPLQLLGGQVGAVGQGDHARRGSSGRCRRRRRGGCDTQVAPDDVLTSALSSGQSAMASEPSSIASVSRYGEATEPESRWSRPMTIGADSSPVRTISLKRRPSRCALAVAEPADPRRQALEGDPLAGQPDPAGQALVVGELLAARRGRWPRCRPGRRTAPPSGTGPCPRRTAGGCTPAGSRGSRTPGRSRPARPRRAGCCRSRRPRRPCP